jgi:hypothetical protein
MVQQATKIEGRLEAVRPAYAAQKKRFMGLEIVTFEQTNAGPAHFF